MRHTFWQDIIDKHATEGAHSPEIHVGGERVVSTPSPAVVRGSEGLGYFYCCASGTPSSTNRSGLSDLGDDLYPLGGVGSTTGMFVLIDETDNRFIRYNVSNLSNITATVLHPESTGTAPTTTSDGARGGVFTGTKYWIGGWRSSHLQGTFRQYNSATGALIGTTHTHTLFPGLTLIPYTLTVTATRLYALDSVTSPTTIRAFSFFGTQLSQLIFHQASEDITLSSGAGTCAMGRMRLIYCGSPDRILVAGLSRTRHTATLYAYRGNTGVRDSDNDITYTNASNPIKAITSDTNKLYFIHDDNLIQSYEYSTLLNGFQPTLGTALADASGTALPSNADGDSGEPITRRSVFYVPVTWTEAAAQTAAASQFCENDLSGCATISGATASVVTGAPVRVGSTSAWRAPITVTRSGTTGGLGSVEVRVRRGALTQTSTRRPSLEGSKSYDFRLQAAPPVATIHPATLSGTQLTFQIEWNTAVGSDPSTGFTTADVSMESSNTSVQLTNLSVVDRPGGVAGQSFKATVTMSGTAGTTITARVRAGAIPASDEREASAETHLAVFSQPGTRQPADLPFVSWNTPEDEQTGDFRVTGTWSEEVTNFAAADVVVSGGLMKTSPSTDAWTYPYQSNDERFSFVVDPTIKSGVVRVSIDCNRVDEGNAYTEVLIPVNTHRYVTWSYPEDTQTGDFEVSGTWNAAVTGFGVTDVLICGGNRKTTPSETWRPTTWLTTSRTFTFTVTPDPNSRGVVRVYIECNRVDEGNAYTEVLIPFDTRHTPRTVDWEGTPQDIQDGEFTVKGEWSDSVTGFVKGDVEVCNGTKGDFTYPVTGTGNENKFELDVTPSANQEGLVKVNVNCNVVDEGNSYSEVLIPYDTLPATVTWTLPSTGWNDAGNQTGDFTISGTWTKPVTGFSSTDVKIEGGERDEGPPDTWSYTQTTGAFSLTITPNANSIGSVRVYISSGSITGGNDYTEILIPYDTRTAAKPFVTWTLPTTGDDAGNQTGDFTLGGDWNETVQGFAQADVEICGGELKSGTWSYTASTGEFSLTITPDDNASGSIRVSIGCTAVTGGNQYAEVLIPFNTRSVTRTLRWNAPTETQTGTFNVAGSWSDTVTGLVNTEIAVTGGTKTADATISAQGFTVNIRPDANKRGIVRVSLQWNVVNEGNAPSQVEIPYDTRAGEKPTVAWDLPTTGNDAGNQTGDFVLGGTWSEAVQGFASSDVEVCGGELKSGSWSYTQSSGVFSLTITPDADSSGSVRVSIGCTAITGGNQYTEVLIPFDTRSDDRTVDWTGTPTTSQSAAFDVVGTWSGAVTEFVTGDITVTGGRKGTLTYPADSIANKFKVRVTPPSNLSGVIRVSIDCDQVKPGNPYSEVVVPFNTRTDSGKPTVEWTLPTTGWVDGNQTAAYTLTGEWSETVAGFDADDIDVCGGTKGTGTFNDNISGEGNENKFTIGITPPSDSDGVTRVSIGCTAVTGGNDYSEVLIPFDTRTADKPYVTWTLPTTGNDAGNQTGDFALSGEWSQTVQGFASSDVEVCGGTLKSGSWNYTQSSGVFSLTITPDADASGSVRVSIGCTAVTGGNQYAEVLIPYDTRVADKPFVTWQPPSTGWNSAGNQTGEFNVGGIWSSPVTGFEANDVKISGGTRKITPGTPPTDSWSYTPASRQFSLRVVPNANSLGSVRVYINCNSVTEGNEYTEISIPYDTRTAAKPFVTWTLPTTGNDAGNQTGDFTLGGEWSQTVQGFASSDVEICGGELKSGSWSYTQSTGVFSLTITPEADSHGVVRVSIGCTAVTGGNDYAEVLIPYDTRLAERTVNWDGTPTLAQTGEFTVHGEWSDSVTDFDADDLEVCGGTKGTEANDFVYPVTGTGNENKFTLKVTPPAGSEGVTRVYINCNAVDEGNPYSEVLIPYNTMGAVDTGGWVKITPLTDQIDSTDQQDAFEIEFEEDVELADGTALTDATDPDKWKQWLNLEGAGIPDDAISVTELGNTQLLVIVNNKPCATRRFANGATFNLEVEFRPSLTSDPSTTDFNATGCSVTSVTDKGAGVYLLKITFDATGNGTATVSADADDFDGLDTDVELMSVNYGESA